MILTVNGIVMSKVDLKELNARVEQKLINVQKHPSVDLWIYNYTPVAQFKKRWDNYTLMARGLILDGAGNIIARPFDKFFNFAEHENPDMPRIPQEPFEVYEKMDGSLGILYIAKGMPWLATRGSFESEQAIKGTQMLREIVAKHGTDWHKEGFTYLFEIIYPQNRIVVNYGEQEKLVLLAIRHNETGQYYPYDELIKTPFEVVERHEPLALPKLLEVTRPNSEGFVLHWPFNGDMRVKIKHDEYVRLHRLLTGVSSKTIWELLRNDETLDAILDNIPDEFYDWVMGIYQDLTTKYAELVDKVEQAVKDVPQGVPRKEQAAWIFKNHPDISAMLFSHLDGKPYSDIIWKQLKPKYEQPFKQDIDA